MANWPSIVNPASIEDSTIKLAHRTNAEINGYVHFRPKWTVHKKSFILNWKAMTSANKSTLETFFYTNQGITFVWTHPETSVEYTVIFMTDELKFNSNIRSGYWSISVPLQEQ